MNKKELERKYGKIAIMICTRDRVTELYGLLESLRHQTYTQWDLFILDSGSQVPTQNYYFIQYMIKKLKDEGHNVKVFRDDIAQGVSLSRQRLVDEVMKDKYNYKIFNRTDDDSICDKNMLLRLIEGIEDGWDLVGCIVPPFIGSPIIRETKFVEPIINECYLNEIGEIILNMDECGYKYLESKIIPTHHFRSSCLYKREIHEAGIDYKSSLSKNGYREEQVFSFKCILKGFKLAIHTGAICEHLMTPTGGERDTMNLGQFNQEQFEKITKKMFEQHGDFIQKYNEKIGVGKRKLELDKYNRKDNLITRKNGTI